MFRSCRGDLNVWVFTLFLIQRPALTPRGPLRKHNDAPAAARMFYALKRRQQYTLDRAYELLEHIMAADGLYYPSISRFPPDARPPPQSTASAPSLRSRKSVYLPMGRPAANPPAGNVKVVVRVRTFLPRGKKESSNGLTTSANSQARD